MRNFARSDPAHELIEKRFGKGPLLRGINTLISANNTENTMANAENISHNIRTKCGE